VTAAFLDTNPSVSRAPRGSRVSAGEPTGASPGTSARAEPVIAMAMAMDRNRLIGRDGGMPWHVPGEQAHFKAVTMGKPIVMGRRTHESIGRPLPGRTNVVVTRDRDWRADGVVVAHSLEEALETGRQVADTEATRADEVVVIGGAALCADAMAWTERLYLTVIDHAFDGDTWLDSFHEAEWREVTREEPDPATTGGYRIACRVLERALSGSGR